MFDRIREMLIKELTQIFRDPKTRSIIFLPPVIQLMVFGYAATTDIKRAATGVYDLDHSVTSRELVARFVQSGYFAVRETVSTEAEARDLIDRGRVEGVLKIQKGFEEDVRAGRTGEVQMILDGTDSNTAGILLEYSQKIIRRYSQDLLRERIDRSGSPVEPKEQVVLESRAWFNDNLESRNFYVPGVVAILLMLVTLMLTSLAVVREKEIGTMEQIMVTPIRPLEFILGKTLPFALVGFFDMGLVVLIARFWFEVPFRGSVAWLFLGTGLYLTTTLGIGLLISTVSRTQQQALMSTFFFFQPAVLLSGFMFPIQNMPTAIQWVTYLDPLRYFLVIIRGLFLKGVGVEVLWPQMGALLILGAATFSLAAWRLKKTLI